MNEPIYPVGLNSSQFISSEVTLNQPSGGNQIGNIVFDRLLEMNDAIKQADTKIVSYMKGEDVPVHELMMSLGKARSELRLASEIRNQMVSAYRTITSMQI